MAVRRPSGGVSGLLRDLGHRSRSSSRDATAAGRRIAAADQQMLRLGQQVDRARLAPVRPPTAPAPELPWLVHVGATDDAGRVTWQLPEGQFVAAPVVAATPVTPDLGSTVSYSTVIEQATPGLVVVRVWQTRTLLGLGLLPTIPAGSGMVVHLYATTPPPVAPPPTPSPEGGG